MAKPRRFNASECLIAAAAIEADVLRLTDGLTEGQFHAPSRGGGWSIGFCLEHLILAGHAVLPEWDLALQQEPLAAEQSYSWWQRLMLSRMEPPCNASHKAPQAIVPSARRPMDDTVRRFSAMHAEFSRRIGMASSVHNGGASRRLVQAPFGQWFRYPLAFSFDLVLAHERRHLWQAWQVRRLYSTAVPTRPAA